MTGRQKLIRLLTPAGVSLSLFGLGCTELEQRPFASTPYATPEVPLYAKPAPPPKPLASPLRQVAYTEPIAEQGPTSNLPTTSDQVPVGSVDPLHPQPPTLQPRTMPQTVNPHPDTLPVSEGPTALELDLSSALALAGGHNPSVAFAAARYREALAKHEAAKVLWLPSINAGMSFNHHDGRLQTSEGRIIDPSRSSLQAGLGVQAVGAGTPMVPGVFAQFDTADAVFNPKIEEHAASARMAAVSAVTHDVLLDTALAYQQLLQALHQVRIAEETLSNAQKLVDLTAAFAEEGEGAQVDADRARAALAARRNAVIQAGEGVDVATVRLAELLRVDPSAPILPQEPTIVPVDLVPSDQPLPSLVATGLSNRPELAEAGELIQEAVARVEREKYAPWLPSVLLGLSQSSFGGGLGSNIDNTAGRFDLDVAVYWNVRNLGFGEKARRDETKALHDQAIAQHIKAMDQVAREVAEASAQVRARRIQIGISQEGVQSAIQALDRDFARIKEGEGLPIEVLQSTLALDAARSEYLRSVVAYNEAQFRLQRALGWPVRVESLTAH